MSFRRKEKSSREARQRLDSRYGVTCGDFSLRRNDKFTLKKFYAFAEKIKNNKKIERLKELKTRNLSFLES
jgi:hypothetical protein